MLKTLCTTTAMMLQVFSTCIVQFKGEANHFGSKKMTMEKSWKELQNIKNVQSSYKIIFTLFRNMKTQLNTLSLTQSTACAMFSIGHTMNQKSISIKGTILNETRITRVMTMRLYDIKEQMLQQLHYTIMLCKVF